MTTGAPTLKPVNLPCASCGKRTPDERRWELVIGTSKHPLCVACVAALARKALALTTETDGGEE